MGHPNILILLVDCLNAEACYNETKHLPLPNIDALRRRGATFDQMMAVASTTSPCVASLLTGTYPVIHGVRALSGSRLRDDLPTMAEAFGAAGYHTAAFVTGATLPEIGLGRGFDRYEYRHQRNTVYRRWGSRFVDILGKQALPQPWLLLIHLLELHHPAQRTWAYAKPCYGRTIYDQALCNLDAYLGQALTQLNLENTLCVLTSDHGEIVSERLWWHHEIALRLQRWTLRPARQQAQTGYHGVTVGRVLVRIPWVMAGGPVSEQPQTVRHPVSQTDILPTIAELAGVPVTLEGPLRGISQAGVLGGEGVVGNRPVFSETCGVRLDPTERTVAVRTGTHTYIFAPNSPALSEELYDTVGDPSERRNLAGADPETAARLRDLALREYLAHDQAGLGLSAEQTRIVEDRLRELGYL